MMKLFSSMFLQSCGSVLEVNGKDINISGVETADRLYPAVDKSVLKLNDAHAAADINTTVMHPSWLAFRRGPRTLEAPPLQPEPPPPAGGKRASPPLWRRETASRRRTGRRSSGRRTPGPWRRESKPLRTHRRDEELEPQGGGVSEQTFTQRVKDACDQLDADEHERPAGRPESPRLQAVQLLLLCKHLLHKTRAPHPSLTCFS